MKQAERNFREGMARAFIVAMVAIMIIGLIVSSCTRRIYVPVVHEVTDSVAVHDTLLQVQLVPYRDSVSVPDTASFLHNPYAYSWAVWSGGVLHHSLVVWPQATATVKVPYFIERWHREQVPQVVEVERPLTRWQQFKMDHDPISSFLLGLAVGYVAMVLRKMIKGKP